MQKHLNEKYASIKIEKDAWEDEKEEIKKLYRYESEIVSLNIGGTTHIQTEKDVLCSVEGSTLAKLFSDMHELKKVNDEVFLDRDGETFETLVNYLRNDRKVFPEFNDKNSENMFYKEMHYWGIDQHMKNWQEQYLKKLDKSVHIGDEQLLRKDTMGKSGQSHHIPYNKEDLNQSEMPSYMAASQQSMMDETPYGEDEEETAGVALQAVKQKWSELGPLRLEDIVANSSEPIDQTLMFGQSKYNKYIIGQIGADGRVQGVGKEINHIIYEG